MKTYINIIVPKAITEDNNPFINDLTIKDFKDYLNATKISYAIIKTKDEKHFIFSEKLVSRRELYCIYKLFFNRFQYSFLDFLDEYKIEKNK